MEKKVDLMRRNRTSRAAKTVNEKLRGSGKIGAIILAKRLAGKVEEFLFFKTKPWL